MMSHPRVEDLSTYLDSQLTIAERQRVEAHLELCGTCRDRLQSMRKAVRQLAALERRTPPPALGYQLKRLSSLEASRPTLVERLEKGASRLNAENALLPMFGVVVALLVIIYLLAWAFYRDQNSAPMTGLESAGPAIDISLDTSPSPWETSENIDGRIVAGRTFDLLGDTWIERGLDADVVAVRLSTEEPEIQQLLEADSELRELLALGSKVRLRLDGRVVEIHFGAPD